jgi:Spy/CpxP family protein refolding chaperone
MLQLRIDRLTGLLGLSDAQKSQAATIFGDAAQATQPLQQQMREARTSLQEAVRAGNTAQIDQLATTIGNLTGKVTAIDSKAEAQFVKILTPEQLAKYPPQGMGGPGGGFGGQRRPGPPQ